MHLFLVHCGYYDRTAFDGVFESHVDLFVAAEDFLAAKTQVKQHPEFKRRAMHIDGLVRLDAVDGCRVALAPDASLGGATVTERAPASWRTLNAANTGTNTSAKKRVKPAP